MMILAPVNLAKRGKTRALCRKVETTKKRGRRELGDDFYTTHSRQYGTCCSRTHWFVSVIMHGQIGRSKGALYLHRCQIKIIRQFFALTWWIYMCKSTWWIRFALWHVFKPSWDKDPQSRQMPHVMVGLGAGKKNVEVSALGCCTDALRSLTCFIVCDATMPPRFMWNKCW